MYANNQQQPMYGGMPSASYHWDHQLRGMYIYFIDLDHLY